MSVESSTGQHGDGAVGEIYAGAANLGLAVDIHAGADVVRDVGDVDLKFVVTVGEIADEDGIVKVAGGFTIDGDDGEVAEIAAALEFGGRNRGGDGAGFGDDGGRKVVGQVVLADDDLNIDAEVVFVAEDFDKAATGILRGGGPAGDLAIDDETFQVFPVTAAGFRGR